MGLFVIVGLILGMFLPAFIASGIGGAKDRGSGIWFLLGFIFSWIAVLIVACLPYPHADLSEERSENSGDYQFPDGDAPRVVTRRDATVKSHRASSKNLGNKMSDFLDK